MRGYLNLATYSARQSQTWDSKPPVELERNPQLLVHHDLDAFQVCRTYERALEEGNLSLVEKLREANQDLAVYFRFLDRQWIKNLESSPTAETVDQFKDAI